MKYAIEKKYDIAVIIAGDNQDNPKEIKRLINPILGGCDVVQGILMELKIFQYFEK